MMKNFYTNLLIRIDRKYLLAISVKTYSKKKLRKHIDVYFKNAQNKFFYKKFIGIQNGSFCFTALIKRTVYYGF